ncbi:type II toxin-antitoxin system PrlF family antitoxin [Acidobacteria bacterium AH-259-D05]|nr:type II toxin-antitoxin system PrlF family antitoxin [Acidobacteria bacterium AH-259-D05]
MKSTLSERGQITIPKKIRELLGLRQGQQLEFETRDGLLIGRKTVPGDPVLEVTGILSRLDVDRALEESRGPKWNRELDADRR